MRTFPEANGPASGDRVWRSILHPLIGARPATVLRLLWRHGGAAPRAWATILVALGACLLRWPSAVFEDVRVARRVASFRFEHPPIFIVGHWRSGTTFLHNLLGCDDRFRHPRLLDCVSPYDFFPAPLQPLFLRMLLAIAPPVRPMDDVPLAAHLPQEEELPLALMGAPSFFNCLFFPASLRRTFAREVLFEGLAEREVARWRKALCYYLAKLSVLHDGRQLLLKNPAHSARIDLLRDLFPDARFIHLHRHPDAVFASTRKLYRSMWPLVALQTPDEAGLDAHILWSYREVMRRLQHSLAALPPEQVVTLRYDDLIADPLAAAEAIYRRFGLDGFARAAPAMRTYLASSRHDDARPSSPPPVPAAQLREEWRAQFEWLGYR